MAVAGTPPPEREPSPGERAPQPGLPAPTGQVPSTPDAVARAIKALRGLLKLAYQASLAACALWSVDEP